MWSNKCLPFFSRLKQYLTEIFLVLWIKVALRSMTSLCSEGGVGPVLTGYGKIVRDLLLKKLQ